MRPSRGGVVSRSISSRFRPRIKIVASPRGWPPIERTYSWPNSRKDAGSSNSGMDEQGLFSIDWVVVRRCSLGGVCEREMVTLESLVAERAAEEEVRPLVGQPVVAGPNEWTIGRLSIAGLGPEMLDVTVSDVSDLRLAESTLAVLGLLQRVLDRLRAVDAGIEVAGSERLCAALVGIGKSRSARRVASSPRGPDSGGWPGPASAS